MVTTTNHSNGMTVVRKHHVGLYRTIFFTSFIYVSESQSDVGCPGGALEKKRFAGLINVGAAQLQYCHPKKV
jgi:hypothetical protein